MVEEPDRKEALSFGEVRDLESPRRAEIVPFDVSQSLAIMGIEYAKHFAHDAAGGFAAA
jgi:hypothetical protein